MDASHQPRTNRRGFLRLATGAIMAGGLASLGAYRYANRIEPGWLKLERVRVPIEGLSYKLTGLRIAQLSDLHLEPQASPALIEQAVAAANALQPDLIALTGDYISGDASAIDALAPALARLSAPLGVFAVLGNHDLWIDAERVTQSLRAAGLTVLVNQGHTVMHQGAMFYVAGLDDGWSGQPDLDAALHACPPSTPVVLLLHEPDLADDMSQDGRVTLQLSGHSHGGQVRLPFIGAPVLPYLARRYDMGLYRVGEMWLHVNPGVGVAGTPWGTKVRLNCRPEITEITLTGEPTRAAPQQEARHADL